MTFISGMLQALPCSLSGDAELELREKLQYPKQIKYEQSWKCVGADLNVGEMGKWSGYENVTR